MHWNIEKRSFISVAGSEHDATYLLQANNATERKEVLVSRGCSGSEVRAENIQFASKLDAIKLEIEALWLTLMQK